MTASHTRSAAWSGVVFVVLDALALFLPGAPPKARDSASHIAATLAENRSALLAGTLVFGLALLALLLFLAALRDGLAREAHDDGLVLAAFGGIGLAVAAQTVGLVLFYGAAFRVAGEHQDAVVRALTDAGNAAIELSKFGFCAFVVGVCLAAWRALPAAMTRTGLAAAALLLLSTVPLASEAPATQFGGGVDLLGAAPATIWIAVLSVVMARRTRADAAVQA